MKAQLHWVPGTDSYALYIADGAVGHRSSHAATVVDGRLTWVEVEPGATMEPALEIQGQFIEVLREAFAGLSITDGSGLNFLRDAVSTRDRLLSLVEKLTDPPA